MQTSSETNTTVTTECECPDYREPAHPPDDERVSFYALTHSGQSSEIPERSDYCFTGGQWQTWENMGPDAENVKSTARTTFYAKDLPERYSHRTHKFDRFWTLQMGRGHTWEDDSDRKSIREREDNLNRCDAILQNCDVPRWARTTALSRVHRTNLVGFNRNHKGIHGACIAFALLIMCDSPEEAQGTRVAKLATTVPVLDREIVDMVIDYAFRKYGDAN